MSLEPWPDKPTDFVCPTCGESGWCMKTTEQGRVHALYAHAARLDLARNRMPIVGLSRSAQEALAHYGLETCLEALEQNERRGDGARTIAFERGWQTRQADAVINAGREFRDRTAQAALAREAARIRKE